MRQPNDRSQSKRMAWKKVVDIIPSNFSQTRILSDDKYAVAQRKVLIRIVGNRHIKRSVSDRGACRSRDDPPNMASLQSHISTRKAGCVERHASSDWLTVKAVRPRESTLPNQLPKGSSTPREAAQARSVCAVALVLLRKNTVRTDMG
jgi:hypothetical protein